jgi:hypothetical protein
MLKKLIFISCGQLTEIEKSLGVLLKTLVDQTPGFQAYFAETVHDLDALSNNVFEGIQQCSGAIIILQDRGIVMQSDREVWGRRSSVWVNQEVAILAYRQFFESKNLPILAFVDPAVKLEGAMTSLIVNPQPLPDFEVLTNLVGTWLSETEFTNVANDVFASKWVQLNDSDRMVIAALFDEGGKNVKQSSVRQTLTRRFGIESNAASQQMVDAKLKFCDTDLVKLIENRNSGDELSVNPAWEFKLKKQCDKWQKDRNKATK